MRAARRLRLTLVALALVGLGACTQAPHNLERYVVARTTSGRVLARLPLASRGHFALSYVPSVYDAPGIERFEARADGFTLIGLSSTSPAVLDYYALEGRRSVERGWWTLAPSRPPRYEKLSLIATEKGRRTLEVEGKSVPLYEPGRALHVVLSVN